MVNNSVKISEYDVCFSSEELWVINVLFRGLCVEKKMLADDISEKISCFASRNGLASILFRSDYVECLSAKCEFKLRKNYLFNLGRNTTFQLVANDIVNVLHANDIPVVLLKGSFLASFVYSDVAFRPMSDIDILVPVECIRDAWQILNKDGDISFITDEETDHHLPSFIIRGCMIEVHRYLFPINTKYNLPIKDIWDNVLPVKNKTFCCIDPLHQVIYNAIHIYYSYRRGGMRLGWFYDFKVLIDFYGEQISLQKVEENAKKWNVWEPVKLILAFFSVLTPDNVLSVSVTKELKGKIKEMILILQTSGNQKSEYSYGLTMERFFHTKGISNKFKFIWNVITIEKHQRKKISFQRLLHLTKNSLGYFKRRFLHILC